MAISYTDPTGTRWDVGSTGNIQAVRSSSNMYDSGAVFSLARIDAGVASNVSLSYGAATTTATTQEIGATNSSFGVSVTRKAEIVSDGLGHYFLRMVETVTNNGAANAQFSASLSDNMWSDSSTLLTGTGSGDTVLGLDDTWYMTSTSSAAYPDPLHVIAFGAARPSAITRTGADQFATSYLLDLDVGESATLLHFYVLTSDAAESAALGNALAALPDYALAGLSSTELAGLANVTQDISADVTTTLPEYGRNLTLTGTAAIDGTGNARDNVLTGNNAANTLRGGDGNDTLIGNGGADILIGGQGDDAYYLASGDSITELADQGTDTVFAAISYSLNSVANAQIENMTLIGGAKTATGNAGDNVLIGNALANTLTGLGGNDLLDGGGGVDTMKGGLGDDSYAVDHLGDVVGESSGQGTDTVYASVSGYALTANVENLVLTGTATSGKGNSLANILVGNALTNILTGGASADTYYLDSALDQAIETASGGVDTVMASSSYALGAYVENLTLLEEAGGANATGNTLVNVLTGNSFANIVDGGAGADVMAGGLGNDIYVVDNSGDSVVEGVGAGIDLARTALATYTLGTNVENGTLLDGGGSLTGNILANALRGNEGANSLSGLDGNDTLRGEGGNDTLDGGAGDDLLIGDSGGPAVNTSTGESIINGRPLTLTISAPDRATGTVDLSGTITRIAVADDPINIVYVIDHSGSMSDTFLGTTNVGDRNGDGYANTTMDAAIASFERLNEMLVASGLSGSINLALVPFETGASTDFVGRPDDDLDGDGIADVIETVRTLRPAGGTNYTDALTEAYDFLATQPAGRNFVFFVSDGAPNDTNYVTSLLPSLLALGPQGTVIRAIGTGAGANEAILDQLDDMIDNDSAQIVLNPQDLDVTLTDLIVDVDDGAWVEIYRNGELVQVIGREDFTVSPLGLVFNANGIALSGSGSDVFTAVLVTSDPTGATVTSSVDVEIGAYVSNDILNGGAGNDTLDGGVGGDRMTGGTGNDIYYFDNVGDRVVELAGEGTDTVVSRISITGGLMDNVENLTLIGTATTGRGNSVNNIINGNAQNNRLYGVEGFDTLDGGEGDDILEGGVGNDTLYGRLGNDQLLGGDGTDYLYGHEGDDTLDGGATYDYLYGGAGNDSLIGGDGNDYLSGEDGDDRLDGGIGTDNMYGGAGNDTYLVDATGDYISDSSGAGVDLVITALNASLGGTVSGVTVQWSNTSYLENLTLTGAATIGIGNAFANSLVGNANANQLYGMDGNDVLDGGAGADQMDGGLGNDIFYVDNGGDILVDAGGVDGVVSTISYGLADGLENLTLLAGAGAIDATGNAASNSLTGNESNNRINGKGGADVMTGGAGNDVYYVDVVGDRVVELAGEGNDFVYAGVSYLLADNVERLSLTGSGSISGAGNALDNGITGNAGANRLLGGAGDDILAGALGNDTLTGGAGRDVFLFNSAPGAANVDSITDFAVVDDTIQLARSVFSAFSATGALSAAAFKAGAGLTGGTDATDRIVYDSSSGALYYDADGSGASAAVQFATLTSGLALAAADFLIV